MRMTLQQQVQVQSFCNTGNIKYVSFYYLKFHSLSTKTFNWLCFFSSQGVTASVQMTTLNESGSYSARWPNNLDQLKDSEQ